MFTWVFLPEHKAFAIKWLHNPDQVFIAGATPSILSFRAAQQTLKIVSPTPSWSKKWGNNRSFLKVKFSWWLCLPLAWEMSQLEKHSGEDWSLPTYPCGLHWIHSPTHFPTPISSCTNLNCFPGVTSHQPVQESNPGQQDRVSSMGPCHPVWQYELISRIHVVEGQN